MNPAGLPPSVGREHIHTRRVVSQGYLRADGLWDIEAGIEDTKTYFARTTATAVNGSRANRSTTCSYGSRWTMR